MTFVEFVVKPDFKAIDQLIADIETAPPRYNARVDNLIVGRGGYTQRLEKEVTPYPGAVKYPVRWKSAKQRRAYFASNGFGRGIPSRRTGKLQKSWRITFKPIARGGDGSISIFNAADYAGFVIGIDQQPFHADTGWKMVQTNPAVAKIQRDLTDDLSELWLTILLPPRIRRTR